MNRARETRSFDPCSSFGFSISDRSSQEEVIVCIFFIDGSINDPSHPQTDVFDLHLTRDLSSAHILDFNAYHSKTDPLLFTYGEILQLLVSASTSVAPDLAPDFLRGQSFPPVLRTITSPSDPAASRNAPQYQHNAVPFDALQLSEGNDIATFSRRWQEELVKNMYEIE
jgi:D123